MNAADLRKRIQRLEKLSIGFGKEFTLWEKCDDPLLYMERQVYLLSLHRALSGVEEARVALAKALDRMRG